MTIGTLNEILGNITYKNFTFRTFVLDNQQGFLIQAAWEGVDTDTSLPCLIKGGKHFVSRFAISDEVIKRAFVAVRDAEMHELMEEFKYKGKAPFHPHNDVELLIHTPKVRRQDPETVLAKVESDGNTE